MYKTRHYKILFFFLLLLTIGKKGNAINSSELDSLNYLIESKSGAEKIALLKKLGEYYRHIDPKRTIEYGNQALLHAKLLNNPSFYFEAYSTISIGYRYYKQLDSAMVYANKALRIAKNEENSHFLYIAYNRLGLVYKKQGNYLTAISLFKTAIPYVTNQVELGNLYNNIGSSYKKIGKLVIALDFYKKTLIIRKETKDDRRYAYILNNISNLYSSLEQYEKAISIQQQSIKIKERVQNPHDLGISYTNLAMLFLRTEDDQLDSTYYYLQKAEIYRDLSNNKELIYFIDEVYADYYQKKGEYQKANELNQSTIKYYEKTNQFSKKANALSQITINYIAQNKFREALSSIDSACAIGERLQLKPFLISCYEIRSEIYLKSGNYKKAYQELAKSKALREEVFSSEIQHSLTDLEVKNKIEEQEKNNQILEKENQLQEVQLIQNKVIIYFSIIVIILILAILYFRHRNDNDLKKRNIELVQAKSNLENSKKELLKTNTTKNILFSIVGHDILNGFHPVFGMVELLNENFDTLPEHDKKDYIRGIHKGATQNMHLIKNLLIWGKSQLENFEFQPRSLNLNAIASKNILTLKLFAENKNIILINKIKITTRIYADEEMLNTVFRNLIANAIKFSSPGKKVWIKAEEQEHFFKVCIQDEGIGMSQEKTSKILTYMEMQSLNGTNNEKGTGLGLIISKDFIIKNKGVLNIESEIDKGTKMCFTLPKVT